MAIKNLPFTFALALSVALAAAGCNSVRTRSDTGAAGSPASAAGKVAPGMNAQGEVVNSAQVEAGSAGRSKALATGKARSQANPRLTARSRNFK